MRPRRVELTADLEQVVVTRDGLEVARHSRCWARHQSLTDPLHATAAVRLRLAHRAQARRGADTTVEHRNLADYDRVFGLDPDRTDATTDTDTHADALKAVSA